MQSNSKLVVVGLGYVGLPLAIAAASRGYEVIGVDINLDKIREISVAEREVSGVSATQIKHALATARLTVTADYSTIRDFAIAVITVPTPLIDGDPDLSFVLRSSAEIGREISIGSSVILESTTYPGTTEELLIPALEESSGLRAGKDFHVGYSPERVDPGNEEWTLLNTPKIVSGINKSSLQSVKTFYSSLGIPCVVASGTREAELSKLLENTFRHVNIALINELSLFADGLQTNLWEAIDLADTKPFGFMKFTPGPGVGGHCLPIDPSYLSWAVRETTGTDFQFVKLANKINDAMPRAIVERLIRKLEIKPGELLGMTVLLVGVAYKKNTGDIREAPSVEIARILSELGARVYGIDPLVGAASWPTEVERVEVGALVNYRVGIILAAHDCLLSEPVLESCDYVLDPHNVLDSKDQGLSL